MRAAAAAGHVLGQPSLIFAGCAQDSFWDRIQRVRNKELSILWRTFIIDSTNIFLLNAIPTVVSVSTFTAYILLGNNLTAAKVGPSRRVCLMPHRLSAAVTSAR